MHQSVNFPPVNLSPIDEIEDIRRRMRVSNLEARLALHEIDAEALSHEISSPMTSVPKREEAIQRRESALNEVSAIKAALDKMYRSFPHLARH